ncbi:DUF6380 family protein [Streptomyces sp. NPDC001617]
MDKTVQGDSGGEKRHATLRTGTASLTATADRAQLKHGGHAGEGAP